MNISTKTQWILVALVALGTTACGKGQADLESTIAALERVNRVGELKGNPSLTPPPTSRVQDLADQMKVQTGETLILGKKCNVESDSSSASGLVEVKGAECPILMKVSVNGNQQSSASITMEFQALTEEAKQEFDIVSFKMEVSVTMTSQYEGNARMTLAAESLEFGKVGFDLTMTASSEEVKLSGPVTVGDKNADLEVLTNASGSTVKINGQELTEEQIARIGDFGRPNGGLR